MGIENMNSAPAYFENPAYEYRFYDKEDLHNLSDIIFTSPATHFQPQVSAKQETSGA
jgi:hypothetical protein